MHYTTPRQLERTLEARLRNAGFKDATITRGTRYVIEDGRECLKASAHQYASVLMPVETLEGYERVLRELPGVIRTQIIHDDARNHREGTMAHINHLRDQVIVIHRRQWDERDDTTTETTP